MCTGEPGNEAVAFFVDLLCKCLAKHNFHGWKLIMIKFVISYTAALYLLISSLPPTMQGSSSKSLSRRS